MDKQKVNRIKPDIQMLPLLESDLPVLVNWAKDEKTLIQWCGPVFDFPLTIEQLQPYFRESVKTNPQRFIFKAVINDKIAGMSELGAISQKHETASLCRIFVDESFRGQGIADLLISNVLEFGFKKLNLTRIELNVYTYNIPAYKCYEKLGFQREGLKRKITKYKNEYWDGYVYGLLREDWEELKRQTSNVKCET
ncbi:MAG: GNAT family protein [Ignavibacteria bacterium]